MAFEYSESGSQGSSTSQSGTLPWYNQYIRNLLGQGQSLSTQPGQVYQGRRVAGLTPDQLNAFGSLRSNIGNWESSLNRAQGVTNQAVRSIQDLQDGPYMTGALNAYSRAANMARFNPNQQQRFMNPYISNVVNEISRLGNENIASNIADLQGSFVGAGQFGSGRNMALASDALARGQREISGAQGNALYQAQNAAGQQYADWANRGIDAQQALAQGNLNLGQFQQGLAGTQGALGSQIGALGSQQQQQGLIDINALLGIGQQQQQQQQQVLDASQQRFMEQQQAPWANLSNYAGLIGQVPTPQQSTSSSTNVSSNWNTNFKRGGLASLKKYQGGGLFDDEDEDMLSSQLDGGGGVLGYLLGNTRQVPMYPSSVRESIQNNSLFEPTPEGSTLGNIGEAMMRAAAQGPANIGQLIGRSGASYFDAQKEREESNLLKSLKKQELLTEASKLATVKTNNYSLSKFGKIASEMGFIPGTPEFTAKVEELMASGKTTGELSVPGKIARDEGLVPGTPEYSDRVTELYNNELDVKRRGVSVREQTADTYAGNLGARRSEQEAKYGEMPGQGGIVGAAPRPPVAAMIKTDEDNRKDINSIADPDERKAAMEAYERQRDDKFSRHPGVLKFTNQGLPIKEALDRFQTEGKEYDKVRQSVIEASEPLASLDFDRALQLNEYIKNSSGPPTGIIYDIPGSAALASTLPGKYGEAIGELRALGTKMIPSLTKGLTPVSNADMIAMSKAGFGPDLGYSTNKATIQRAKASLGLGKEFISFMNAAQEIGLSPSQAQTEWNKYIKKNPLFDLKYVDKHGVLKYNMDPSLRGDILNRFIEDTKRKFFTGLRSKRFSPMSESSLPSTSGDSGSVIPNPERIIITPEMLQGE